MALDSLISLQFTETEAIEAVNYRIYPPELIPTSPRCPPTGFDELLRSTKELLESVNGLG